MSKRAYAVRLNKDPVTRKQIAIMRLAGFTPKKIGALTGRAERTIIKEIKRPEHKKIVYKCVINAAENQELPQEAVAVIKKALDN